VLNATVYALVESWARGKVGRTGKMGARSAGKESLARWKERAGRP